MAAVNIQPAFSECILSGNTRDTQCHPMMLFAPWYLMKGALKKNYLQNWERPSRRYFRYFRQIKVYGLPCHHVSYPWPYSQLKKNLWDTSCPEDLSSVTLFSSYGVHWEGQDCWTQSWMCDCTSRCQRSQSFYKVCRITEMKPDSEHGMGEKICVSYDPPHLLKIKETI